MSKKEDTNKYHLSLKLKSVDELVDIILRKDDKERNKNQQIAQLERKIKHYKDYQKDSEKEIAELRNNINRKEVLVNTLRQENDNLFTMKNHYYLRAKLLSYVLSAAIVVIILFIIIINLFM